MKQKRHVTTIYKNYKSNRTLAIRSMKCFEFFAYDSTYTYKSKSSWGIANLFYSQFTFPGLPPVISLEKKIQILISFCETMFQTS